MKNFALILMSLLMVCCTKDDEVKAATVQEVGKTLVVYFTSSGNSRQIAEAVKAQMPSADVIRIETVRETTNDEYIANNYALGNELLQKINDNPESADNYPAIKPVEKDCADYDNIIFVTPLWHAQMAAPAQSYLFLNRSKLAGKNFGMIVSSWSSGISTVVNNARRLVPDVVWMGESLWINHSNHSNRASLIQNWLPTLRSALPLGSSKNFAEKQTTMSKMYITIDGQAQAVTLVDNQATKTLVEKLQQAPVTVTLSSSGGFEIWGALGFSLPTSNEQINAQPGDVILYNGSNICIFYGTNSWSYTRLGKIDGLSESELRTFLKAGEGNITVTLSLSSGTTTINSVRSVATENDAYYSLSGQRLAQAPAHGIYIENGIKKIAR